MNFRVRSILIFFTCLLLTSSQGLALTAIKGEEAKTYLGDAKVRFLAGHYVYAIFSRSHRDSMNGRFSDGILFNPDGGNILFLKNKDGDRKFVVDASEGREKEPVTEDVWRQKIQNILSDDNPDPTVFLDDSKKELAVLYTGKNTEVTNQQDEKGRLKIQLLVAGGTERQNGRQKIY